MRRCIHWLTALLIVSSCTGGADEPRVASGPSLPDEQAPLPAEEADTVPALACEGLEQTILAATPSRDGFRVTYGDPDSVLVEVQPNRHVQGGIDSLFTMHYAGMIATFRTPPAGSDLISSAEITDNRYLSDHRIGIGVPEQQVIRQLGEPGGRDGRTLVYDCGMGAEQPVAFHLRDGAVSRISIEYYVD